MNFLDKINIHSMNKNDVNEVLKIQNETGLSFWSETDYKSEIENKDSIKLVAKSEKKVVGFALVRLVSGEHGNDFASAEIYNIAVINSLQHKGVGQKLFDKVLSELNSKRVSEVWLEVRESNLKAIKFYTRNGFAEEFVRKNYYQKPLENAYVLKIRINYENQN